MAPSAWNHNEAMFGHFFKLSVLQWAYFLITSHVFSSVSTCQLSHVCSKLGKRKFFIADISHDLLKYPAIPLIEKIRSIKKIKTFYQK